MNTVSAMNLHSPQPQEVQLLLAMQQMNMQARPLGYQISGSEFPAVPDLFETRLRRAPLFDMSVDLILMPWSCNMQMSYCHLCDPPSPGNFGLRQAIPRRPACWAHLWRRATRDLHNQPGHDAWISIPGLRFSSAFGWWPGSRT